MKFRYLKGIKHQLLLLLLTSVICLSSFVIIPFYPFKVFKINTVYIYMGIFALFETLILLLLIYWMRRKKAKTISKVVGVSSLLAIIFALIILFFLLPLIGPVGYLAWPHYTLLSISGTSFLIHFIIYLRMGKVIRDGNDGYFPYRSFILFSSIVYFAITLFYVVPFIRFAHLSNIAIEEIFNDFKVQVLTWSGIHFLFNSVLILFLFYIASSMVLSGIEDKALGLRGNISTVSAISKKYELGFWFGNFSLLLLLITSILSLYEFGNSYLSLVALFFTILMIRVVGHFWRSYIHKNTTKSYQIFREEHGIMIFASVMLLMFSVVVIVFGSIFTTKLTASKSAIMTFAVLVPWALLKIFFGLKKYITAIKVGEPYALVMSYLDIFLAIFTFANVLLIVFNLTNIKIFVTIASFVMLGSSIYSLYVAIRLMVIGVRGCTNKRLGAYRRHQKYFKIISMNIIKAINLTIHL